ncbi:MAG: VWA domain-containing protein [Lachnospiraceae bacterium]|nr:VWA domain-containing protein [Lachnospiraceae bacterium]
MKNNIDKLKMLNDIDDKYIEEAADKEESKENPQKSATVVSIQKKKPFNYKMWGSIAAAVVILAVSVTVLTFGIRAGKDNKQKNDSVLEISDTVESSAIINHKAEDRADAASAADESRSSEREASVESGTSEDESYSSSEAKIGSDTEYYSTDDVEKGIFSSKEAVPDISDGIKTVDGDDVYPEKPITNDISPDALLLTAGRWNDNANWGFFMNLVNTGKIAFPAYGLDPINRIVITLQDEDGNPLEGYNVSACSLTENVDCDTGEEDYDGKYLDSWLYEAVSDKNGKAYLFLRNDSNLEEIGISVRAEYKPLAKEVIKLQKTEDSQGNGKNKYAPIEKTITVKGENRKGNETQVMFILDTTGSMGDELAYLQKDFSKIVEDVNIDNISYSVNFYKDEGDEYVVKSNPFTSDVKEIQTLLNAESADGGGDLPEAVAQALSDCMQNTGWNTMSGKKIAFLIFDAPPHDGEEEGLYTAVKAAAKRGIHVIPVVASNADRKTELFGRALAIMTNGEYVFLTDDSGIGESHLEPIIGDYEVEKLHDIIVKIIEEYAE